MSSDRQYIQTIPKSAFQNLPEINPGAKSNLPTTRLNDSFRYSVDVHGFTTKDGGSSKRVAETTVQKILSSSRNHDGNDYTLKDYMSDQMSDNVFRKFKSIQ